MLVEDRSLARSARLAIGEDAVVMVPEWIKGVRQEPFGVNLGQFVSIVRAFGCGGWLGWTESKSLVSRRGCIWVVIKGLKR